MNIVPERRRRPRRLTLLQEGERFERRAVGVAVLVLLAGAFLSYCAWGPLP